MENQVGTLVACIGIFAIILIAVVAISISGMRKQ